MDFRADRVEVLSNPGELTTSFQYTFRGDEEALIPEEAHKPFCETTQDGRTGVQEEDVIEVVERAQVGTVQCTLK